MCLNYNLYFFLPGTTYDYDIALLKIKPQNGRGIEFNDYVQPACLPKSSTQYTEGTVCHISGWGTTNVGKTEYRITTLD